MLHPNYQQNDKPKPWSPPSVTAQTRAIRVNLGLVPRVCSPFTHQTPRNLESTGLSRRAHLQHVLTLPNETWHVMSRIRTGDRRDGTTSDRCNVSALSPPWANLPYTYTLDRCSRFHAALGCGRPRGYRLLVPEVNQCNRAEQQSGVGAGSCLGNKWRSVRQEGYYLDRSRQTHTTGRLERSRKRRVHR